MTSLSKRPTAAAILQRLAYPTATVSVHRYKWSHDKLRKKLNRLARQGKLRFIRTEHDHLVFGNKLKE